MALNRTVEFSCKKPDFVQAIKDANIREKDLNDASYVNELIIDGNPPGKITILEDDKRVKKYPVALRVPDVSRSVLAYDESIQKYSMLQGTLAFTGHSLIEIEDDDYSYCCMLTAYFLTSAKRYQHIKIAIVGAEPENEFKKQYLTDRYAFLDANVPEKSILFIDGPLIGSQASSWNIRLVEQLMRKGILPIFYVKNSLSKMLIDSTQSLSDEYNSDLDFANKFLDMGERTSLMQYVDQVNDKNSKIFGYIKCYDGLPQRFEMHLETYNKNKADIEKIFELLYYYSTLHGDQNNQQIRPVAIAEKFAREALHCMPIKDIISEIGLEETMNARRGFG